jgi:hypothetical protein
MDDSFYPKISPYCPEFRPQSFEEGDPHVAFWTNQLLNAIGAGHGPAEDAGPSREIGRITRCTKSRLKESSHYADLNCSFSPVLREGLKKAAKDATARRKQGAMKK